MVYIYNDMVHLALVFYNQQGKVGLESYIINYSHLLEARFQVPWWFGGA